MVFISTQFTKQHYIADVIAGVLIAEICLYIGRHTKLYKKTSKIFDKINAKVLGILFMTGNKKKTIFNALFLTTVFAVTLYSVFYNEDLSSIINYIRNADLRYWIIGVIFVLIFIECESAVIYYMLKGLGEHVLFSHCCLYSFIGFFFCLVTPSATGGQPAQLYFMKKRRPATYSINNGSRYSGNYV